MLNECQSFVSTNPSCFRSYDSITKGLLVSSFWPATNNQQSLRFHHAIVNPHIVNQAGPEAARLIIRDRTQDQATV